MQESPLFTLTRKSVGVVAARRFVGFDGAQIAVLGARSMGVSEYAVAAAGENFPVKVLGTAIVEAGGVIARGAAVKSSAAGKAIDQAGAGAIAGYAMEAATADGDLTEILLVIS